MRYTAKRKVFTCPKCGIPNIAGDRKCMYCETRFTGVGALFTFVINRFRKNSKPVFSTFKVRNRTTWVIKKISGVSLLLLGMFLFAGALMDGQFKNWIIAVILMGYGGILIK